jgi:hypothetical protein
MSRSLLAALLGFSLLGAAPASAQSADSALARIDSLLAAGVLRDARVQLDRWFETHPLAPGLGTPGSQAHALYLKGRLASDWAGAEDAWLSVVLGYPTAPVAPDALLLLGKGLLAAASTGRPATAAIRAASYLERLVNDYPGNALHDEARLWLARAWAASGRAVDACGLLRRMQQNPLEPAIARAVQSDSAAACRSTDAPAANPHAHRFAVQVAALQSIDGANELAARLARAGLHPRIILIEGSTLLRVRVDAFDDPADAEALASRIRRLGFEAAVVDDVAREKREHAFHSLCADCARPSLSVQ